MNSDQFQAFRYAFIVSLGGFIFGLDAAIISGTVKFITSEFQLSDLRIGAVVSAPGFGVLFALLGAGYLSDNYGRKKTLQLISILYLVSAVCSALAPNFMSLVAARFIGGLAFTSLSLASMYIGEIAPSNMRGKLVSMNQINIVIGLSAAYFINLLILKASQSPASWVTSLGLDQHTWRWMLGAEIIPAALWFWMLNSIPESPRWLMLMGRANDARASLERIFPGQDIEDQMEELTANASQDEDTRSTFEQVKQLFAPSMRTACLIGLVVAVVQPITGINAIMFYAPTVFEQVGIGTDAAFAQAVYVGLSSIVFTVMALLLIDRIGRRPLILWGLLWGVASLGVCSLGFGMAHYELSEQHVQQLSTELDAAKLAPMVGVVYDNDVAFKEALKEHLGETEAKQHEGRLIQMGGHLNSTLILLGILSFIGAFHFSIGPIMWVLFSEIFPIAVRGIAIPFFALITSIISYLVQQFFPLQLSMMGASEIFLFYAGMSALGLVVLVYFLPETKNKTIEEIEIALGNLRSEAPIAD
ncbi:sugar porter family MFS transporter [Pontibacter sp. G13]|uniref:sugar porter family MFS transporter n=1 Tax=Pontibacter sp. G13 TaxID=3074898 RepID=UPI002889E7DB|nr:sugar porter family MFS transporter [Pontibacter sp. G13]WNJ19109.1 sugar porter family MFS transporter [Pontibacter sp. G13]